MQTFHPLIVIADWEHTLKLYELDKQEVSPADRHPPEPKYTEHVKVTLALRVMTHIVTAILNVLVAEGKNHCTECYELYSVVNEVTNEHNEG
jgi:hypothetical protein